MSAMGETSALEPVVESKGSMSEARHRSVAPNHKLDKVAPMIKYRVRILLI